MDMHTELLDWLDRWQKTKMTSELLDAVAKLKWHIEQESDDASFDHKSLD